MTFKEQARFTLVTLVIVICMLIGYSLITTTELKGGVYSAIIDQVE